MRRHDLEGLTREQLITEAERLGVPRPRVLTQPELVDEIISRSTKNERERARARGWLGRARDLLKRVVEKGLHLPDAARAIRSNGDDRAWPAPPPPLPTVTLAEIYAAQGHLDRAVGVLDEVLAREPDHSEALLLRTRFVEQAKARARWRGGAPVLEEPASAEDEGEENDSSAAPEGAGSKARTDVSEEDLKPTATSETEATSEAAKAAPGVDEAPSAPPIASPTVTTVTSRTTVETDVSARDPSATEGHASGPPATDAAATDATATDAAATDAAATDAAATDAAAADATTADATAAEPSVDPALPARYDLDEIVAIAVDPRTIYLYWEVRATTLARAQASATEGALCVRVASVTASWDGPLVTVRDLRVDSLDGDRFIRDIVPGAHVRVSVGWLTGEVFEPFAVGIEVTAPHLAPSDEVATAVATWSPRPGAPVLPRRSSGPAMPAGSMPAGNVHLGHQDPVGTIPWDLAPTTVSAPRPATQVQAGPFTGTPGRLGGREALVVSWNQQGWVVHPEGLVQEGRWFQPGGASELGREGPIFRLGGASDLGRGGASELGRSLGA